MNENLFVFFLCLVCFVCECVHSKWHYDTGWETYSMWMNDRIWNEIINLFMIMYVNNSSFLNVIYFILCAAHVIFRDVSVEMMNFWELPFMICILLLLIQNSQWAMYCDCIKNVLIIISFPFHFWHQFYWNQNLNFLQYGDS